MRHPSPNAVRRSLCGLLAAAAVTLASCAGTAHAPGRARHAGSGAVTMAPEPDSVTAGLWHLDETGGTRAADAGPFRIDGVAGIDTRTDFGRVRGARHFTRSVESFLTMPYSPAFERGSGLTLEAWIYLDAYGDYEDTPIVGRWSPVANDQSWLFAVVGRNLTPPLVALPSPGYHRDLVSRGQRGQLLFAFQPGPASLPLAYVSNSVIELERWTHVAVSYDGVVVRFYIDGRPEAQYASQGSIRESHAPLMVGNYLDPRSLTDFGGDLRADNLVDRNPYYAFQGLIDELRVSTAARSAIALKR